MPKKGISEYIANSNSFSAAAQNRLRQLVERYPYFHAVRLLYLRSLFMNHDPSFHDELRKAALYMPSRSVLYNLIEGERLNPNRHAPRTNDERKKDSLDDDRTSSLIEQFLDSLPEQTQSHKQKADPTVDYLAYLSQSDSGNDVLSPPVGGQTTTTIDVINEFLAKGGKLGLPDRPEEELLKPRQEESEGDSTILTERLAKIYIKQRKYDKALEIIQKLSLKYPKKNRYFADQIRFLQKLITNDKNKQTN